MIGVSQIQIWCAQRFPILQLSSEIERHRSIFQTFNIYKNFGFKMKPKGNSVKKPAGKSFADAMFGIKDIAMTYEDLQGGPVQPKIPIKKEVTVIKKEVTVIKKEPIGKPVGAQKLAMSHENNKEVFRISAGKQFEGFKSIPLIPIQNTTDVYELTLDGKQSQWEYNVFCDGIEASAFVDKPELSFGFEATDVKQGGLGNCYFIATLASLAHLPKVLQQRIPKFKGYSGKDKSFEVTLFESGKCLKMVVDNLFPKIFAKPVNNDISLMVLQKAYAQAYGNFEITNVGYSCDSLRDLTGAPTYYIDLKDREKLINQLSESFAKRHPLIIASKETQKLKLISPKHSYNVLDFDGVDKSNILLKLRDPRGCDYSLFPTAKPVSQEEAQNGIFWVDYPTLIESFEVITSCEVKLGNKYIYKSFANKELNNGQACLLIMVKQKAEITITAHQKHKKFFDDKFNYRMVRLLVARVDQIHGKISPVQVLGSDFKVQQVCTVSCQLQPGQYLVMSKLGTGNQSLPQSQQPHLTLSFYTNISVEQISVQQISGNVPVGDFLKSYIRANRGEFKESISDKKLERYFGPLYGYICMYYDNRSGKSVIEQLDYEVENVKIGDKKISLEAGEQKILLHEIGQGNNCSHKFAFKTQTLYKG